jgi:hypothetical protein
VAYTLQFKRPVTAHEVSRMFISNEMALAAQARYLEARGCAIVDIFPPLPGDMSMDDGPRHTQC